SCAAPDDDGVPRRLGASAAPAAHPRASRGRLGQRAVGALVDLASVTAAPPVETLVRADDGPARRLNLAISVIVPTQNERRTLPRLLTSMPPDVELILCDASDDGTPEIARLLRPHNTRVLTVEGSIAAARQVGAEASHGDLLVFSDADVTFAPHYFERLA